MMLGGQRVDVPAPSLVFYHGWSMLLCLHRLTSGCNYLNSKSPRTSVTQSQEPLATQNASQVQVNVTCTHGEVGEGCMGNHHPTRLILPIITHPPPCTRARSWAGLSKVPVCSSSHFAALFSGSVSTNPRCNTSAQRSGPLPTLPPAPTPFAPAPPLCWAPSRWPLPSAGPHSWRSCSSRRATQWAPARPGS